jgi:hypothetical protein
MIVFAWYAQSLVYASANYPEEVALVGRQSGARPQTQRFIQRRPFMEVKILVRIPCSVDGKLSPDVESAFSIFAASFGITTTHLGSELRSSTTDTTDPTVLIADLLKQLIARGALQ